MPPGEPLRDNDLVTLSEAAPILGCSHQSLYQRHQRGTVPVRPRVIGRTVVLYSLADLTAWWASRAA